MNLFIRKVLQVFYFPSTTVVKTGNLVGIFGKFLLVGIFRKFLSNSVLPVFLQILIRKWDQVEEIERGLKL